ncbi:hypothetical protein RYH80_13070 [Halobaculum sp. MBLA0147]|uniref:DUF7096 domain-containing protein n=1 Tax=Halobaculum sp. MBLA0147 TaxID=3079934 RepID=UPI00352659A4
MRALPVILAAVVVFAGVGHAATYGPPAPATPGDAVTPDQSPAPSPDTAAAPAPFPTPDRPTLRSGATAAATETSDSARNVSGSPNVTRVLALPSNAVDATELTSVRIDAGSATAWRVDAGAVRLETLAVRERVAGTDGAAARAAAIRSATDELGNRTAELRQRQAALIAAFNAGRIDERTFLTGLASVDRTAELLHDRSDYLGSVAESSLPSGAPTSTELSRLDAELTTFDSPIRERVAAALAGEIGPIRVYVATTDKGLALSTLRDGTYVREVYRGFLWEEGTPGLTGAAAANVTARSYPEIWAARNGTSGEGSNETFTLTVDYPGGVLETSVRGGVGRVFREVQRLDLDRYPARETKSEVLNNLRMEVTRTFPGGPLRVTVTDNTTGEPVNASVLVNTIGANRVTRLGTTGDDGVLWALGPSNQGGYAITAVDQNDGAVIVSTTPLRPVTVGDALRSQSVAPPARRVASPTRSRSTGDWSVDDRVRL